MWGDREVLSLDGRTFTEKTFSAALKVQFTPTLVFPLRRQASVYRHGSTFGLPEHPRNRPAGPYRRISAVVPALNEKSFPG